MQTLLQYKHTSVYICVDRGISVLRNRFITLEGIDGGGKSLQIELLSGWLTEQGKSTKVITELSDDFLGTLLREVLPKKKIVIE